jgi:hypothetical protein
MMAKKKRRLGHITKTENAKVQRAFDHAERFCRAKEGSEKRACLEGLNIIADDLKYSGFKIA